MTIWLLYTSSGLRWVYRVAKPTLDANHIHVVIDNLHGSIAHLKVDSISVTTPSAIISAKQAEVFWQPLSLLYHHINIQTISAQALHVTVLTSTSSATLNNKPIAKPHKRIALLRKIKELGLTQIHLESIVVNWQQGSLLGHLDYDHDLHQWNIAFQGHTLDLKALSANLPDNASLSLNAVSDGKQQQALLEITSQDAIQSVKFQTDGQWQKNAWHNQLIIANIPTPFGSWWMPDVAQYTIGTDSFSLTHACWTNGQAEICPTIHWQPQLWSFKLHSNTINLDQWSSHEYQLKLGGTLTLDWDLQYQNNKFAGHMNTSVSNLTISPLMSEGYLMPEAYFEIQHSTLELNFIKGALNGSWRVLFRPQNTFNATFKISPFSWRHLNRANSQGSLSAHLEDIGILNYIVPNVSNMHGTLTGHLFWSGKLANSNTQGALNIENGEVEFPTLGITLKNLNARLSHEGRFKKLLLFVLTADSGPGHIKINGNVAPPWNQPTIKLHISGSNVLLTDTPALNIRVTPELAYTQTQENASLKGFVRIPFARIDADLFKARAQLNPDIVYVNNQGKPIAPPQKTLPFSTSLNVILGNDFQFKGFGVTAKGTGSVRITGVNDQATTATGNIIVTSGDYNIYGKQFIVTNGRVIYDRSPLNDPSLNITGNYKLPSTGTDSIGQMKIGVRVTGTVKNPQVTLFSDPSMTQENILAYIFLGHSLNTDSGQAGNNSAALAQAALILANQGGDANIINSIQTRLGLSQLAVGTLNPNESSLTGEEAQNVAAGQNEQDQDNTALFVGKSITSRLSVGYGVGLFNGEQQYTASIALNRYLTLNAATGNSASGADLIFTINR